MSINMNKKVSISQICLNFQFVSRFITLFCEKKININGQRILTLLLFWVLFNGNMIHGRIPASSECDILPQLSRTFLSENFPEDQVAHIEKEKGLFKIECYHVILTNGVDIHFKRSDGEWIQINGVTGTFPLNILPKLLVKYVSERYHGKRIVIVTRKDDSYIIKLNNEVELLFDNKGRLSAN